MLHARTHRSRMTAMIGWLMPECIGCVARACSGLCSDCPTLSSLNATQELTEKIVERNVKQK